MRIAIMGAGGVGGCLGALLARADNQVTMIARGPHLEAIRQHGLRLKRLNDDFTVRVPATDDPKEIEPVELVLLTVKTYQLESAIPVMRPLVREDTTVLTLQNGVESPEELGRAFGPERILPGASYTVAHIEEPGVIVEEGPVARIVFGEVDGQRSARAEGVQGVFQQAGIEAEISDDVIKSLWTKYLLLAPVSGITSASRTRIHKLLQIPESKATFLAAMKEVEAVGRAHGVDLDEGVVETMMQLIEGFPDFQNSMHADIELGRPLELEALSGAVVRIGRREGVPTPVNELLYSVLLPHNDGATG